MQPSYHWGRGHSIVFILGAFLILVSGREYGLADNGDFGRYFGPYIDRPAELPVNWPSAGTPQYARRFFRTPIIYWHPADNHTRRGSWISSAHLFWALGYALNCVLYSPQVVNLRILVLPFFVVHLGLFAFVLRSVSRTASSVVPSMLFLLIFSDALLLSFYTSFYAESLAILSLFGLLALAVAPEHDPGALALHAWFGVFFAGLCATILLTKRQYVYLALPAAGVLIWQLMQWRSHPALPPRTGITMAASLAMVLLATMGSVEERSGSETSAVRNTSYNSLYFGVMMFSADKLAMLSALGLPKESSSLVGVHAFTRESTAFIAKTAQLRPSLLLRAAVFEPQAYLRLICHNLRELGNLKLRLGAVPGADRGHPPPWLRPLSTVGGWLPGGRSCCFACPRRCWPFS